MKALLFIPPRVAGLLGITAALIVCLHLVSTLSPQPVLFNGLREFKDFAAAKGLFCHTGTKHNCAENHFFVAEHSLSFEVLQGLATTFKRDCGLTPAWPGMVWVSSIAGKWDHTFPDTIGGNVRIWGNVLVAGDEQLMNRIEDLDRAE